MRVIVAGCRPPKCDSELAYQKWHQDRMTDIRRAFLSWQLSRGAITYVILGGAKGVDLLARQLAQASYMQTVEVPADWRKYGKAAGGIRNRVMADEHSPDGLIAIWDGKSPGTRDMIQVAVERGLPTLIWRFDDEAEDKAHWRNVS